MEPERQAPVTVWCGGINAGQDASIRLVPNESNQQHQQVTDLRSQEPLAVLKVHSNRLEKHSRYFQACLSTRCPTHPDAPPSMEFNLELIHGLQVASYTDCFRRMYTPLRKNFKDVKSSLELLRVASQIEFLDLVNSICLYLANILWSEEDELRIWQFSSYPDFPRSQAEDLVARLQIGEPVNDDYRKKLISRQITQSIHIALCDPQNGSVGRESFLSTQSFFEDLFGSIGQSELNPAFENAVVTIVSKEVKEVLESFHEDCRKHATFDNRPGQGSRAVVDVERVSGFEGRLQALCWALELLLKAKVAREVFECLLNLELLFPMIHAAQVDSRIPVSERFAELVTFIFQEVVAGRLLMRIQDRVLRQFETWKYENRIWFEMSTQKEEDSWAWSILLEEVSGAGGHQGV